LGKHIIIPARPVRRAFGLTLAGISSKAAGKFENKYKFNEGTELTNDFDISLYETPHRSYDPQIGRFLQIDEFGEVLEEWSSYVFALNNPISFNDPEGLYPDDPLPKEVPKDAPAPTLPNVTVVALRKTGDVFHGFNRYYSILAKTDGDLSRIVNDQFRNEMYRYQELAQFRNRVNEMTRANDEVALEIGSNFIPMGWLVKIGKLRYLQKVYLLKRGKAITTVGKGTNLVDDGANVAVNAVENAAKGGFKVEGQLAEIFGNKKLFSNWLKGNHSLSRVGNPLNATEAQQIISNAKNLGLPIESNLKGLQGLEITGQWGGIPHFKVGNVHIPIEKGLDGVLKF
jgi:RHS repeat-associated protein